LFFLSLNIRRPWKFYSCEPFGNSSTYPARVILFFLIAYAILRSIPNKLGGVVALALSIVILIICPFIYIRKFRGYIFYPLNKILFWIHVNIWVLLTWLGARPVEDPYVFLGQVLSFIYFVYYFLSFFIQKIWDIVLS